VFNTDQWAVIGGQWAVVRTGSGSDWVLRWFALTPFVLSVSGGEFALGIAGKMSSLK